MSHEILGVLKFPSLSEVKESVAGLVHTLDRIDGKMKRQLVSPVNNYLKTPEEIEAELSCQVNFEGITLAAGPNTRIKIIEHKDGYINIHDPESINQGFMEENY